MTLLKNKTKGESNDKTKTKKDRHGRKTTRYNDRNKYINKEQQKQTDNHLGDG